MVKIREVSDIHLDWYAEQASAKGEDAFWYPKELPDDKDTILIIAGDLWVGTKWIQWAGFSWIGTVAKRFKQVLVVHGNHDYWPAGRTTVLNHTAKCRELIEELAIDNVQIMDRNTYEIDDVIFVGATLWTDMNRANPIDMQNMPYLMVPDGKIVWETAQEGRYSKFTSQRWVQMHYKHKDYIKLVTEQNKDKKIVVITHHIPVLHCGDPAYNGNASNAYYMSDLSEFILDNPHIKFWFHGHSHFQHETMLGETMIINNCVGYASEHCEQEGLVQHKVFEV
jgi:predicted phosphohydrolase